MGGERTLAESWAAAGAPAFLAAARDMDRSFALYGVDAAGGDVFRLPLPARAHAGAAHPQAPLAVVFARRPGTFGLVIDCARAREVARLETPAERHFMGHGCFSSDGELLLTAENGYGDRQGRIGLWARDKGWRRVGEYPSHGIGPHDILPLPGGGYVIANGGIATHPAREREKLNLATMRPNLAYVDAAGRLEEVVELDPALHQASIRHLALRNDGLVAFAMQHEGDAAEACPLLGLHRRGEAPRLLAAEEPLQRGLCGYVGAVAFGADGARVAITSPVGGVVHVHALSGGPVEVLSRPDICGLGLAGGRLMATDGLGGIARLDGPAPGLIAAWDRNWDNHIIPLPRGRAPAGIPLP